jgi:Ran GTPase-activating protein (RanGAP) involved in mRNA processing and transport
MLSFILYKLIVTVLGKGKRSNATKNYSKGDFKGMEHILKVKVYYSVIRPSAIVSILSA